MLVLSLPTMQSTPLQTFNNAMTFSSTRSADDLRQQWHLHHPHPLPILCVYVAMETAILSHKSLFIVQSSKPTDRPADWTDGVAELKGQRWSNHRRLGVNSWERVKLSDASASKRDLRWWRWNKNEASRRTDGWGRNWGVGRSRVDVSRMMKSQITTEGGKKENYDVL